MSISSSAFVSPVRSFLPKKQLQKLLPSNIHYIASGVPVAQSLRKYLIEQGMIHPPNSQSIEFYVSDNPEKFKKSGSKFLNNKIDNIKLILL